MMWNLPFGVTVLHLLVITHTRIYRGSGSVPLPPGKIKRTCLIHILKLSKIRPPPILTKTFLIRAIKKKLQAYKKVAFLMIWESLCVSESDGLL